MLMEIRMFIHYNPPTKTKKTPQLRPRKKYTQTVTSYHRPSPQIASLGIEIGNATKPLKKERGAQHHDHCMAYAIYLYNQFKNGDFE